MSKNFLLPHERTTTLKSAFTSVYRRRKRTKEVQHALKDVSFDVKKGEFFGIVGRNGSGKSTLLKMLAGIYQPSKGSIAVHGKLVPFIELGVGFNPELTGRDNVYLNGAMMGFSRRETDAMYDDIVAFAELERFMDQKLKNYSSGMQVRLAFSLATRAKADILLVDEVLAVGDADFQHKCFEYFKSLKAQKKTVVFVTHDMSAVREYCDRAMLIDASEVVTMGKAEAVAQAYTKLFRAAEATASDGEVTQRWGSGTARISSPKAVVGEKAIEVDLTLTATDAVSSHVSGIGVESADGVVIFGTNTQILKQPLPSLQRGEELHVSWSIANILADGTYYINLTSHGYGGQPVYDWWDHALTLRISRDRPSAYAVAPDASVSIKASSSARSRR